MRAKTLLLTTILSAAGMVASYAQGVYSVNVVGYVTVTCTNKGKYQILSNPLIATNNQVQVLIPAPPYYTVFYKLPPSGVYESASYFPDPDTGDPTWANGAMELPLGEGFFVFLPSDAADLPITFVGEVAQRDASNKTLPGGAGGFLSLQGSMVPQEGSILNVLQFPTPSVGDLVYKLPADGVYQSIQYYQDPDTGDLLWSGDLDIKVAEGFFTKLAANVPWNRNFVVPTP